MKRIDLIRHLELQPTPVGFGVDLAGGPISVPCAATHILDYALTERCVLHSICMM